ncbi:GNAT family N-acetyltransferase [Oleiharenicola lentus]|uniref:GNAT family N-acetyltransferase n=1 Tax=Oleiharenicola lentus TaxID=2508720 RepID=A0A4Q1C3U8_9BACT|nr:GNAT family N-acetyltransferase [Oleiharenicola lentus]RXK52915.1 GNAT family N-acetyltransferase [Oleiharenicola lentus]
MKNPSGIDIQIITTIKELESIKLFWLRNQWHPNADFDFYNLIIRSRREIISPCIFVIRKNEEIISLIVGRIENSIRKISLGYLKIGSVKLKQLVLIDGGALGELTKDAWAGLFPIIDDFILNRSLDCAQFSQIRADSIVIEQGKLAIGGVRYGMLNKLSKHWQLKLPISAEEFLKSRSRKHRHWIKRLSTILDRDFPSLWEIKTFQSYESADEFCSEAEKVASTTYHRKLGAGFRGSQETLQRLKVEAARGGLRGYILYIEGKPCAFWHCHQYGDILHMASTGYIDKYRKYELGTVLLVRVFSDHCGQKSVTVDFGLGEASYKERFGNEFYEVTNMILYARNLRGSLICMIFTVHKFINAVARTLIQATGSMDRLRTLFRRKLINSNPNSESKEPNS